MARLQMRFQVDLISQSHSKYHKVHMVGLKRYLIIGVLFLILLPKQSIAQTGKIAVGAYHSIVLSEDGNVYTFGSPTTGVLGQGEDKRIDIAKLMDDPAIAGKNIVKVSIYDGNALILTEDGKVYGMGDGSNQYAFGPTLEPTTDYTPRLISETALDTAKIVDVEMGDNHSVILNEHGDVFVMGYNNNGYLGIGATTSPITAPTLINQSNLVGEKVIKISASGTHTLMMTESNKVFGFGENLNGQLGDSTTTSKIIPIQIPQRHFDGKTIKDINAAQGVSTILTTDGVVYRWGNFRGALGQGAILSDIIIPTSVTHSSLEGKSIKSISGIKNSYEGAALVSTDGSVYVIGENNNGNLGKGDLASSDTTWTKIPASYFDNKQIVDVALGSNFSLFQASDGSLFSSGLNAGNGFAGTTSKPMPLITTEVDGSKVNKLVAVDDIGVLIDSTGSGYIFHNELSPSTIFNNKIRARDVNGIKDTPTWLTHSNLSGHTIVDVKAGGRNSYLLTEEGKVFSFGVGRYGTLGTGDILDVYVPTLITHSSLDGKRIIDIAVSWNRLTSTSGASHALLLAEDGSLFSMGSNDSGQLGLGDTQNRFVPTPVTTNLTGKTIVKIAANAKHSMAIAADGTVFLWGDGKNGEMGFGNTNDLNVPTAASHANVGGKKATNGAIGFSGGTDPNPHFLVLLEDSLLYSFGEGSDGGLGRGNKSDNYTPGQVINSLFAGENIIAIEAGYRNTSMILTESGKIYSWGNVQSVGFNKSSFTDYSSPTLVISDDLDGRKVVDIAIFEGHSLALIDDGTVLSFGVRSLFQNYGAFGNGHENDGTSSSDYPNQKLPKEVANFTTFKSPLPSSNLVLHLDAGRGFTTSNDSVSAWKDLSGSNHNAFQTNLNRRPIVKDSTINNRPGLRFDSTLNYFTLPTSVDLGIQSNDYEVFIVAKSRTVNSDIQFLMAGGIEQFELHLNGAVGARAIPTASNYVDVGSADDFSNTEGHLFNVQSTNTYGKLKVNRALTTVDSVSAHSSYAGNVYLGIRFNNSLPLDGDIAEVIIYNSILSANDRRVVESYLMKKYAIQNFGEVDQNLTGTEGWRFLASPIADSSFSPLLNGLWTQGFTGASNAAGTPNVYTWSISDSTNNTTNWTPLTDMSTSLPPGSGALVYVFSDDDGPGAGGDGGFPKTMNIEGIEPSGDRTLTSLLNANVNGWTLLGNPFKKDVDWDSFTKTNLSNSVYLWDNNSSDWKTWNGILGDLPSGEIGALNGFFVQTIDANPTLEVPQTAKTGNQSRFLGKQTISTETPWLSLEVKNESHSNEMWVMFSEDAESGFDNLDALKLQPLSANYVLIGSLASDTLLMDINALPFSENEIEIPLHFESTMTGVHEINLSGIEIFENWQVSLIDTELDITSDLTEAYQFEVKSKEKRATQIVSVLSTPRLKQAETDQQNTSRFVLVISPAQAVSNSPQSDLPLVLELQQNYPNPFNPVSVIEFGLPQNSVVSLEVFDVLGRKVAELVTQEKMDAGRHSFRFNGSNLASGMYIYRLVIGEKVLTKKMTLIK